eukprot:g11426.t1
MRTTEFYEEVFQEMANFGEIEDMVVVDNISDHMVGNLFVKYYREEDAEKALENLTGRYYGGELIQAEFSPVSDFREARCRQFHENSCNRGGYCNFMHIKHIPRAVKARLVRKMYEEHPEFLERDKRSKKSRRSRSGGRDRDRRAGGGRDREQTRGREERPRGDRDRGRGGGRGGDDQYYFYSYYNYSLSFVIQDQDQGQTEDAHGTCPFYLKIGACRHGDQCSRHHVRPTSSQTLLLSHLYPVPAAAVRIAAGELWEEPTYDAVQKHLEDFYDEVFHELATYGEIEDMIIADNVSEHMLGNIYVKYFMEEDAEKALQKLTGRYYAGRVIKAEFSPVTDFREARCRAFHEARCNRGGYCNFLHIKHIPRGNKRRLILEMYEDYPHYAHKKERIQKWSKTKELELKKQQEQQQNASQNGLMHPAMAAWGAAGGLLPIGPPVGALGGPGHAAFAAAYGAAPWNGAGMAAGGYWGAGPGGAGAGGPPGAAGFPIDFAAMGGPYGAGLMGGYGGGGHKGGHYDSYYGGGKKGKGGKNYNWTGGMAALPPMSGPPGRYSKTTAVIVNIDLCVEFE